MTMRDPYPVSRTIRVTCSQCGFDHEATGSNGSLRLQQRGVRHARRKGHRVTATITLVRVIDYAPVDKASPDV